MKSKEEQSSFSKEVWGKIKANKELLKAYYEIAIYNTKDNGEIEKLKVLITEIDMKIYHT